METGTGVVSGFSRTLIASAPSCCLGLVACRHSHSSAVAGERVRRTAAGQPDAPTSRRRIPRRPITSAAAACVQGHTGQGVAISADGSTLAVGAPHEASGAAGINGNQRDNSIFDAGAVYVFVRSGNGWTQQAYLKASNPQMSARVRPCRGAQRRRQHAGRVGVLGVEQRQGHQRQPEGRVDPAGRRRLRLHAPRHRVDAAGLHQGVEHRRGRDRGHASAKAISSASRWRLSADGNTLAVGALTEDSAAAGHQRQPGGQLGAVGGRGLRLHAIRRGLVAAGLHQALEHRCRRHVRLSPSR